MEGCSSKGTRGVRVGSTVEERPELESLSLRRDSEHSGLTPECPTVDEVDHTPVLTGCTVLTREQVQEALQECEAEPDFEEEDVSDNVDGEEPEAMYN